MYIYIYTHVCVCVDNIGYSHIARLHSHTICNWVKI